MARTHVGEQHLCIDEDGFPVGGRQAATAGEAHDVIVFEPVASLTPNDLAVRRQLELRLVLAAAGNIFVG